MVGDERRKREECVGGRFDGRGVVCWEQRVCESEFELGASIGGWDEY